MCAKTNKQDFRFPKKRKAWAQVYCDERKDRKIKLFGIRKGWFDMNMLVEYYRPNPHTFYNLWSKRFAGLMGHTVAIDYFSCPLHTFE